MGIHGLSSFIQDNPHFLQDHKLHDTRVIIDGNNLYHFLHYSYRTPFRYGGDYDRYGKNVREFFKMLKSCNVTPIVLFDGGYEKDDRKLRTTIRRTQERIHLASFISQGMRGKILPILAYEVFRDVLVQLDIPHVTCDFEADDQIAALANEWDCPVVSNDSDFYVFDISAGFIPFDQLNLEVCVYNETDVGECETSEDVCYASDENIQECKYLACRIYRVQTFLQHFSCTHVEVLPALAALLGNDFVDNRIFETFFSQVSLPKGSKHDLFKNKRYEKIVGLMLWLKDCDSVERILNRLLPHIHKDQRQKVAEIIKTSVKNYTCPKTRLKDYFSDPSQVELGHLHTYGGHVLPDWFVEQFRQSRVPKLMLNAASLRRIFLLSQVEDMKQPSSYISSRKLRQIIYGLLLSCDRDHAKTSNTNMKIEDKMERDCAKTSNSDIKIENKVAGECFTQLQTNMDTTANENHKIESSTKHLERQMSDSSIVHVVEYDREKKSQRKILVEPTLEIPQFGPLPSLEIIPDLGCKERQQLLVSAVGQTEMDVFDKIPQDIQLVLRTGVYWILNAQPKVTQQHLRVLLVMLIKLAVIDPGCREAGLPDLPHHVQPKGKAGKRAVQSKKKKTQAIPAISTDHSVYVDSVQMDIKVTMLRSAQERLHKFSSVPQHSAAHSFNSTAIHSFAQFQTCFQAVTYLNQLLLEPLKPMHPAEIYNGTFAYNFCQELRNRPKPDLFISETLGRGGCLADFYLEMFEKVSSCLPTVGCFQEIAQSVSKKMKKKAAKKKGDTAVLSVDMGVMRSLEEEEEELSLAREKKAKYADVENKFSTLVIDEDSDDDLIGY